ncbi:hypothetical protein ACFFP0_32040, partial [Rhizobium puerariae]
FSYQNVTVTVSSNEASIKAPRNTADHVSLSSNIQLSNNRRNRHKSQSRHPSQSQTVTRPHQHSSQLLSDFAGANLAISPERGTSSPAAPPPSSVTRLIEATTISSQQGFPRKDRESYNQLKNNMNYEFMGISEPLTIVNALLSERPAAALAAPARRMRFLPVLVYLR